MSGVGLPYFALISAIVGGIIALLVQRAVVYFNEDKERRRAFHNLKTELANIRRHYRYSPASEETDKFFSSDTYAVIRIRMAKYHHDDFSPFKFEYVRFFSDSISEKIMHLMVNIRNLDLRLNYMDDLMISGNKNGAIDLFGEVERRVERIKSLTDEISKEI